MNKVLAKRLAKKAREKELFLLFKELYERSWRVRIFCF